jgi:hypothetical protein
MDFSSKVCYVDSLKWKKISTNNCCRLLHINLHISKTVMYNSLYVFDNWGEKFKP